MVSISSYQQSLKSSVIFISLSYNPLTFTPNLQMKSPNWSTVRVAPRLHNDPGPKLGVALELAACGLVPEHSSGCTKEAAGTAFWWGWLLSSQALSGSFVSCQAQRSLFSRSGKPVGFSAVPSPALCIWKLEGVLQVSPQTLWEPGEWVSIARVWYPISKAGAGAIPLGCN